MSDRYHIVQLANGTFSLRSAAYGETFHPVIGPVAEAQALYVEQLKLRDRLRTARDQFVVWDVGLGAAGNPLAFLNEVSDLPARVRIVSFDYTTEPLQVARQNSEFFPYLKDWEASLAELIARGKTRREFATGFSVDWELVLGDFPKLLEGKLGAPAPHAIFYDAFSPATNPSMWTLPLFRRLFERLDPGRPCVMPTYSRSTLLRATLLLAGFYVGKGHATGEKEETTIAANLPGLIAEPLDRSWLMRARRSRSAEPLHDAAYRQEPLSETSWERLRMHPQFG